MQLMLPSALDAEETLRQVLGQKRSRYAHAVERLMIKIPILKDLYIILY